VDEEMFARIFKILKENNESIPQSAQHTLAADVCPYCRGERSIRHPEYGVSAVCPRCHGSGRAAKA
jgi:DnaJ-class molecular chaperone